MSMKEQVDIADFGSIHIARTPHASAIRSLAKAVTWRLLGSVDTFVISYLTTGQLKIGVTIASAEVVTKFALYYFHERGWAHIRWGVK